MLNKRRCSALADCIIFIALEILAILAILGATIGE